MVNFNFMMASLSATSVSISQGLNIDSAQIKGLNDNSSNQFGQLVANLLTGAEKSALEAEKVNLSNEIISNDKLQTSVFKAASVLFIMGEIKTVAATNTQDLPNNPVVQNFIQSENMTTAEQSIFIRSIKVSAIEISIREIVHNSNIPTDLGTNAPSNNNLNVIGNTVLNAASVPTSQPNSQPALFNLPTTSSNAEPTLVGNNSAKGQVSGILNAVNQAAAKIQTIGKEITIENSGASSTAVISPDAGKDMATQLRAIIVDLKNAVEKYIAESFSGLKETVGQQKAVETVRKDVNVIQTNTDAVINKANALISRVMPKVAAPQMPAADMQSLQPVVPNSAAPVQNSVISGAVLNPVMPVSAQLQSEVAQAPARVNIPAAETKINEMAKCLNNISIAVESVSMSIVAVSVNAAAVNTDSQAPSTNSVSNGLYSISAQMLSVESQFSGSNSGSGKGFEAAYAGKAEVQESIAKIVDFLNEMNGKLEISNRIEFNLAPKGTDTTAQKDSPLQNAAKASPDVVVQQRVVIKAGQAPVASRDVVVSNPAAKPADVQSAAAQKETPMPVDTKADVTGQKSASLFTPVEGAKTASQNPAGDYNSDRVQPAQEQVVSTRTNMKYSDAEKQKLNDNIEWLANNISIDVKSAAHLKSIADISVFEQIAQAARSVREQVVVKQVAHNLAENAATAMKTEVRMMLQPENLGHVFVKLEIHEKVITGKITVMNTEVKEILRANIVELKAALVASGVEVQNFTINLAGDSPSDNFGNTSREYAAWEGGAVTPEMEMEAAALAFANNNGYLNYFA